MNLLILRSGKEIMLGLGMLKAGGRSFRGPRLHSQKAGFMQDSRLLPRYFLLPLWLAGTWGARGTLVSGGLEFNQ